jgi:3-deoxy-D-manno-octulosonate 8-phosphate phosphatase (KDO 8-P phosphatase)
VPLPAAEVAERARRIRLLLFDVDGVFTDASVQIFGDGSESKTFSIRDGTAVGWAIRSGYEVALLSGRPSAATTRRAAELGITRVHQETNDKVRAYARILEESSVRGDEVGYMGDDLLDLPVFARVGLSGAPADAAPEVRDRAHWVSAARGGAGAVREFIELVLRASGKWDAIVARYLT